MYNADSNKRKVVLAAEICVYRQIGTFYYENTVTLMGRCNNRIFEDTK